MKKMLIESCNDCPSFSCRKMFRDCPLPDEPEKMKGKICIIDYKVFSGEVKYDWWIDLNGVNIEGQETFNTEAEARQDAMEWAKKLNVEVEE